MSKARLVITAVVVEGRRPTEVAAAYNVSRAWVYALVARYRAEGDIAFEPRSKRPSTSPRSTPAATIDTILEIRRGLVSEGLDAGSETIVWHLEHHHQMKVSRSTVHRVLQRAQVIIPEPKKHPKSSYIRFAAEQPNECWQADFTHYRLTTGVDIEILCWIDDHSRYALSVTAHHRVTGPIVLAAFRTAIATHGIPFSTLTDNGLVFTTRFARGSNEGRNALEAELVRLRVIQKNSRPNHPRTCGKVERFQQTLKDWLDAKPRPSTIAELQTLLDDFTDLYNHRRPHSSLPHRSPPVVAYTTRPKATPGDRDDPHHRVRHDRVDEGGSISLRVNGRMHHIGVGRPLAGTRVILLIQDYDIRIIHAATGEIIRALTLDPTRSYQGTGKPPGGPKGPRKTKQSEP